MLLFLIFMWFVGFINWKQLAVIGAFEILLEIYRVMKESGKYEN